MIAGVKRRLPLTVTLLRHGAARRLSPASPGRYAKGTQRRAPVVRLAPLFIGQERLTDVVTPDSTPLIGHGRLYRNPNHSANNTGCPAARWSTKWRGKYRSDRTSPVFNKITFLFMSKFVFVAHLGQWVTVKVSCVKALRKSFI